MLHTTLAQLKEAKACEPRYKYLCKSLGGVSRYGKDTPLSYSCILDICGLEDCLWALWHGNDEAQWLCRLAALGFAQRVEHLTQDRRVADCNRINHLYLHGEADAAARDAARAAARDAARDAAWAAWDAARATEQQAQVDLLHAILRQVEAEYARSAKSCFRP